MGLESGEFINDLVQTNPVTATDPVSEGSNHLQLIKKVLQQTFPNYNEEFPLTIAEAKDVALKGVANDFIAANSFADLTTFKNTVLLENAVLLRGSLVSTSPVTMLALTNQDFMEFGAASNAYAGNIYKVGSTKSHSFICGTTQPATISEAGIQLAIREADVDKFWFAGDIMYWGPDVNATGTGSLGATNSTTGYINGSVQMDHRVGGAEIFHTKAAGVTFKNNKSIAGRDTSDLNDFNLARVGPTNLVEIGESIANATLLAFDNFAVTLNSVVIAEFRKRTEGSLLVDDYGGTAKKVGFRNPSPVYINGTYTVSQANEGQIIYNNDAAGGALTLAVLEASTTLRVFNRGTSNITIATGATTLEWLNGAQVQTGARTVGPGGVAELYWSSTNVVTMFGSGIS